jgi:hypothetical protein
MHGRVWDNKSSLIRPSYRPLHSRSSTVHALMLCILSGSSPGICILTSYVQMCRYGHGRLQSKDAAFGLSRSFGHPGQTHVKAESAANAASHTACSYVASGRHGLQRWLQFARRSDSPDIYGENITHKLSFCPPLAPTRGEGRWMGGIHCGSLCAGSRLASWPPLQDNLLLSPYLSRYCQRERALLTGGVVLSCGGGYCRWRTSWSM